MRRVTPFHTGAVVNLCMYCKHRSQTDPGVCAAYPGGIPQEILWMNVDHRQSYGDDGGVRFELLAGLSPEQLSIFNKYLAPAKSESDRAARFA